MVAFRGRLPTGVNRYPSSDILADSRIFECEVVHIELYSDAMRDQKSLRPDTQRQRSANCLCQDALVGKASSSSNCGAELAHAGSHEHVVEAAQTRLDQHPQAMHAHRETVEHPFGT
jgi:hypothetical protein